MNTLDPQEVKHTMHKSIRIGCATIPEEESTNEILEAWDDANGEDLDPATVLAA